MGSFQSFLLQGPDIKDNMTLILLSLAQITQPSRRGADGRRREVALLPKLKKSPKNSIQLLREDEKFHPLIYFASKDSLGYCSEDLSEKRSIGKINNFITSGLLCFQMTLYVSYKAYKSIEVILCHTILF